jgi:hypothetical protein
MAAWRPQRAGATEAITRFGTVRLRSCAAISGRRVGGACSRLAGRWRHKDRYPGAGGLLGGERMAHEGITLGWGEDGHVVDIGSGDDLRRGGLR